MARSPIPYNGRQINGRVGTIPVPIVDEELNDLNLDGKVVSGLLTKPDGTQVPPGSIGQRAPGSHIADAVHSWDAAGTWVLDVFLDNETVERYSIEVEVA